jgi:uncharacterized protein involved in outer membrane biogenesis
MTMPRWTASPRWRWAGGVLGVLVLAVALGEWAGWPFLGAPLARALSKQLDRRVELGTGSGQFQVRFFGGLRLRSAVIDIGAPAWSQSPHMLHATDAELRLRYIDLWRASRGEALRIESLGAAELDAHLERLADGRASWQFGTPAAADPAASAAPPPQLAHAAVRQGRLRYTDAPLKLALEAEMALTAGDQPMLTAKATGRYDGLPLKAALSAEQAASAPSATLPASVKLQASVGRTSADFQGQAGGPWTDPNLQGHLRMSGPSLAAVGDALQVTLPTTAPFRIEGELGRSGNTWRAQVADATVGSSRLAGDFSFRRGPGTPLLTGKLTGTRLMMVDLAPVVGKEAPAAATPGNKVLPTRPFDLASLRAMDADVQIDIAEVDLNTSYLEPLRPLRTHLTLAGGVLKLSDVDARTAEGRLAGNLQLDGRGDVARWDADLSWRAVLLERWLKLSRKEGQPPWVSGRLGGTAKLTGQGRSTAEILGSLQGQLRTELRGGRISHLTVEAAGLDVAQALGVLIKGDETLRVQCGLADLVAKDGQFRPRTMVLDTNDSVLWVDGALSLATESMDLRLVVTPKDFSPLALRTPIFVRGKFAQPEVSLDKKPLAAKVGLALLLGLINPLAALIPLVDAPGNEAAADGPEGCAALVKRGASVRAAAPR